MSEQAGNSIICIRSADLIKYGCPHCFSHHSECETMLQGECETWLRCTSCKAEFAVARPDPSRRGLTISRHPHITRRRFTATGTTESGTVVVVSDEDDESGAKTLDPDGPNVQFLSLDPNPA